MSYKPEISATQLELIRYKKWMERELDRLKAFEIPKYNPTSWIFGYPPDYAEFDATGFLQFYGLATAYRDELYQLVGEKLETPGSDIVQDAAESAIYFKTSCDLSDYVTMSIQLNHDWKLGSSIYPHLHWWQASANLPNWLIQYRWQVQGAAKTTAWSNQQRISQVFTYAAGTLNQISTFGTIAAPVGAGLSDIVQVRILRDTANASGLFAGADPLAASVYAVSFDIHIQVDTIGSDQEYIK